MLTTHRSHALPQAEITRSPQEAEEIIRGHLKTLGSTPSPEAFAKLAADHR